MTAYEAPTVMAARLGVTAGQRVMEVGFDHDVDDGLRAGIEGLTGTAMLDDDAADAAGTAVDAVLMWFRLGDGDLPFLLDDARVPLAEGGTVWVVTPVAGKPGHVDPDEVGEAAQDIGMAATACVPLGAWQATPVVRDGGTGRPQGARNDPSAAATADGSSSCG
ncbi:DUF3052 family protein [Streptomyces sp. NPDC048352]|uniref:DUF3052 family protein n=1 Tax=Streptomyces sp. NPDC048352 TaxID=3154718 RepID=UPI00341F0C39